jgi:Flp pilus assembly protein TadG
MPFKSMCQFRKNQGGGVVLIFALMMPVLMGLSAAAIEYAGLVKRRAELQRAADAASIAGVNQFKLANTDDASVIRFAIATANSQSKPTGSQMNAAQATADVIGKHAGVHVMITEVMPLSFGKLLQIPDVTITTNSTAKLTGTTRLCLLALDPLVPKAFSLEKNARIAASDCSLYSNSMDRAGISGGDSATATAIMTCSAGGFSGNKAIFLPPPATGCPPLKDPLADRAAPVVGGCISLSSSVNANASDTTKTIKISRGAYILQPGTYCNGLEITDGALVTLRPGVYVIQNGPLVVHKKASMSGENVGFYFTGNKGGLLFDKDSIISLTAPKDGDMASLLFFEERQVVSPAAPPEPDGVLGVVANAVPPPPPGAPPLRQYRIISDNARMLLGTIYLPAGRLIIDSSKPVADQSAYTVIVARLVNLYEGPNLVLNAAYANSDVPVPKGVGPSSADTQLTQ